MCEHVNISTFKILVSANSTRPYAHDNKRSFYLLIS